MTITFTVRADEPDTESLETFFANLDLITRHKNLILNTPEYYNIHIAGTGVFPLYVPTFPLFIGDLLLLWEKTEWKQEDKYFYCITGSPLSGSNSSQYWSKTEHFASMATKTFGKQIRSAATVVRYGICEIPENNPVIMNSHKRQASNFSINELVNALKQL